MAGRTGTALPLNQSPPQKEAIERVRVNRGANVDPFRMCDSHGQSGMAAIHQGSPGHAWIDAEVLPSRRSALQTPKPMQRRKRAPWPNLR